MGVYPVYYFDIVWASPLCTEYSPAKTSGVRDLHHADRVACAALRVIRAPRPHVWFMENPHTMLHKRDFMRDLWYLRHRCTYCRYGFRYKKDTDIWTNIPCSSCIAASPPAALGPLAASMSSRRNRVFPVPTTPMESLTTSPPSSRHHSYAFSSPALWTTSSRAMTGSRGSDPRGKGDMLCHGVEMCLGTPVFVHNLSLGGLHTCVTFAFTGAFTYMHVSSRILHAPAWGFHVLPCCHVGTTRGLCWACAPAF
mmetsp:Transcript_21392/g.53104  ORF Transcript_21392/g.53104 Transcript_21392/m.53104 type:complete len:253 (-) Transcript_21392:7-765(-)